MIIPDPFQYDAAHDQQRPGLIEKILDSIPGLGPQGTPAWQVIPGHLHQKTRGNTAVETRQKLAAEGNHQDHEKVGGHHSPDPEYGANKPQNDHRTRRAGDQGRQHSRHHAVPSGADHSGGQNGRYRAPQSQHHGNDRQSMQTDAVHQAVHEESHPGKISGIFDQAQEKEKRQQVEEGDVQPAQHTVHKPFCRTAQESGQNGQALKQFMTFV